jgi:hypothetical protein
MTRSSFKTQFAQSELHENPGDFANRYNFTTGFETASKHLLMQCWFKLMSMPGFVWLICGTTCIAAGFHAGVAINDFSNNPLFGDIAIRVGVLAYIFAIWRAVGSAWHARSAILLFLYLAPHILAGVLFGLKGERPVLLVNLAKWLADQLRVLPVKIIQPVDLSYFLILLFVIAVPIAAIITLASARYWRRAGWVAGDDEREPPTSEIVE